MQMVWVMNKVLSGWFSWKMDGILGKGPRGSMIQDFARSFYQKLSHHCEGETISDILVKFKDPQPHYAGSGYAKEYG